jgi:uncharacterized membrane protein YkvA (DUF1232 family)
VTGVVGTGIGVIDDVAVVAATVSVTVTVAEVVGSEPQADENAASTTTLH